MPQKRNPDVAELTRGKTGRVIGDLVALLTLLKGLPMTYNRDLQEDKERLFDAADTVRATVRLCAGMLRNVKVNKEVCLVAAGDPALLATDLADYLVRKGLPFRQAHHVVGNLVRLAEDRGVELKDLPVSDLKSAHSFLTEEVKRMLGARSPVDFAAVTGMYVATLFVVFQITNYLVFRTPATPTLLVGGALIVAGGLVVFYGR